jgi:LacI family transcriptional regulator
MEGDMGLIFQAGEKLLEKNANAIVCLDDDVAVQLIRFLMRRGVRVPEDVVVTGTNDTADSKNTDYPSLTTLRIPHKEMGKAVRDYIFDGIRVGKIPPRTIIFEPELVIRQSAPK